MPKVIKLLSNIKNYSALLVYWMLWSLSSLTRKLIWYRIYYKYIYRVDIQEKQGKPCEEIQMHQIYNLNKNSCVEFRSNYLIEFKFYQIILYIYFIGISLI